MGSIDEQLTATRTKQLELSTELKSHGHGNKKQIDDLSSEVEKTKSDFNEQLKNVTNQMTSVGEQLTATKAKQLELSSDFKNHGHGNKKLIDDISTKVDAFVSWKNQIDKVGFQISRINRV